MLNKKADQRAKFMAKTQDTLEQEEQDLKEYEPKRPIQFTVRGMYSEKLEAAAEQAAAKQADAVVVSHLRL